MTISAHFKVKVAAAKTNRHRDTAAHLSPIFWFVYSALAIRTVTTAAAGQLLH
jgi:hypothetical protein